MKQKILWMLVSCFMVLSLVTASCSPAAEEEVEIGEAEVEIEEVEEEEVEEEVVEEEEGLLPPEVPKYGGELIMTGGEPRGFDTFLAMYTIMGSVPYMITEGLIEGDWSKGLAGTGEADWYRGCAGRIDLMKGNLAESFELPDDETIILHIRPGVHWWDKPPLNGRELTADDVVWTIDRAFTQPRTYFQGLTRAGQAPTSVKALDKYTVEVKFPPQYRGQMLFEVGDRLQIFPPDVTEAYGDANDWRNVVGLGAWMLTDFVPASSLTYTRNPNYWQYDPIHPENRLPYPDSIKELFIGDASTRLAAFRTGKIDTTMVGWEDGEMLLKQAPEVKYVKLYPDHPPQVTGRVDKPELPFKDIRVRQALNMAINRQEIVDDYHEGHALFLAYPVVPYESFLPYYVPFEELPENVQEILSYNPEKARALLAEAGYPDGFKTKVNCSSNDADFMSMIREYFLDIGVDMVIEPLEMGAFFGMSGARSHEEMMYRFTKSSHPYMLLEVRSDQLDCKSYWDHPRVYEAYEQIGGLLGVNDAEVSRIIRELTPFLLENAWGVWLPAPETYTMWWPWLQNYHGESDVGYNNQYRQWTYTWVDEALKKSMGY